MNDKIKGINKRFIRQTMFLTVAVILISFIGIFIININSIKSINQWGLRSAESFMLRGKVFVNEYERKVENISQTITYIFEYASENPSINLDERIDKVFSNINQKGDSAFGYLYLDGKYRWFGDYIPSKYSENDIKDWYDNVYSKKGQIHISNIYFDSNNRKRILVSKLLDDNKSAVAFEIPIDNLKLNEVLYGNEDIGSETVLDGKGNVIYHECSKHYSATDCMFLDYTDEDFKKLFSAFHGKSGSVEFEHLKGEVKRYYFVDENGWVFFISVPNKVISDTLRNVFGGFIISMLFFISIVMYLGILNYKEAKKVLRIIGYFDTIGNTYYSGVVINMKHSTCKAVKKVDEFTSVSTTYKDYNSFLNLNIESIECEFKEIFRETFSLNNIRKRLNGDIDKCYIEYKSKFNDEYKWVCAEAFPVDNITGKVKPKNEILILFKQIHKEKVNALEQKKLLEDSLAVAKNAVKAKSDFFSRMSHDMRTPMNAMIGFANVAENNIENKEKVKDCLLKITAASKQLLHLVDEILDMAKIEQGKLDVHKCEINIYDFINETNDIFKIQCEVQNKKFEFKHSKFTHEIVITDNLRLQKILNNLLSNAVKYTDVGGTISFEVKEALVDNNHSFFKFIISDTGIGMSDEFLNKLFEPFEREETEFMNQVSGVGLGMAIVKNTVQLLGGRIDVSSELGKGSKFTVLIPCEVKESLILEDINNSNNDIEKCDIDFTLSGKRFLVVEDNFLNMEIAKELLLLQGIETVLAYNGKEAVDTFLKYDENYFDVVLMDIQMPVMNGYEATKSIRAIGSKYSNDIPIIAMTANAFSDDIIKATESGMNGHISKPVDYNRLKEMLYNIINKSDNHLK